VALWDLFDTSTIAFSTPIDWRRRFLSEDVICHFRVPVPTSLEVKKTASLEEHVYIRVTNR